MANGTNIFTYSLLGKDNQKFKLVRDISDAAITLEPGSATGTLVVPKVTVKLGEKTLVSGTDYTTAFSDNGGTGRATITVTAKGDYAGIITTSFDASMETVAVPSARSGLVFDGTEQTGVVEGAGYVVTGGAATSAGTHEATVSLADPSNSQWASGGTQPKVVTWSIAPRDISSAQAAAQPGGVYSGAEKLPDVTVTLAGEELQQGTDYELRFSNNVDAGTAIAEAIGCGDYTGHAFALFEISAANISSATAAFEGDTLVYAGEPLCPIPAVSLDDTELMADVDYELTYAGNTDAGKAYAFITGVGNYKGTVTASFEIAPKPVSVLPFNDLKLEGNSDPEFDAVVEGLVGDDTLDYQISRDPGEAPGSYVIRATGTTSQGNYAVSFGTAEFVIVSGEQAEADDNLYDSEPTNISEANIALSETSYAYDGEEKRPDVSVSLAGTKLTSGIDYTVSYMDNLEVGLATVTVTGIGNYTGAESATFKIVKAKNPLTVKAKSKSLKAAKLAKKKYVLKKRITVKKAKGKVTYKNASKKAKLKKFKVNKKTGAITVPKGTKKGTYKLKVKVTAKGNANYKTGSKTVKVKVKVK